MTAIREQVLAALFVKVQSIVATIPTINTERNRSDEVKDFPSAVLLDGGQKRADAEAGCARYELFPLVEIYSKGTIAAASPEVSEIYAALIDAFVADITLGGLAADLTELELDEPEAADDDERGAEFVVAVLSIKIVFTTQELNRSAQN